MARALPGELEQIVMLAILRLENGAYGAAIIEEIESRSGRRTADAAVYVVLRRLEKKAYIASQDAGPTPARAGRKRRYYLVEAPGLQALRASRQALVQMWDGLERVLEQR